MSQSGFKLQRAPGTAKVSLTEEDKAAKQRIEEQLANCRSYAEAFDVLNMASKGTNSKEDDEVEDLYGDLRDKEKDDHAQEPKWFAAATAGLIDKMLNAVDDKLNKRFAREESGHSSTQSWRTNEDEEELEYDAAYITSEEDDMDLMEFDQGHLQERLKRRKKRKAARDELEQRSQGSSTRSRQDFKRAQISVTYVSDDDFVQHLVDCAENSWMQDSDYWGLAPFTGYGERFKANSREPPILKHDATGPQFDQWFKKWRLYLSAVSGGVHPLAMQAFLTDHIEKSCTVETWQWVNQNHKNADAAVIVKALKSCVFRCTNMARHSIETPNSAAGTVSSHRRKRRHDCPLRESLRGHARSIGNLTPDGQMQVGIHPDLGCADAGQAVRRDLQNRHWTGTARSRISQSWRKGRHRCKRGRSRQAKRRANNR